MVTPPSFLPDSVASRIGLLERRGFATDLQLGGTTVQLFRHGLPVGDPTRVVVTFADRQEARVRSGEGAVASYREGTVEAFAPWDVERGDVFTLGTGDDSVDAEIRGVRPDTGDGTVSATFAMGRDDGGA